MIDPDRRIKTRTGLRKHLKELNEDELKILQNSIFRRIRTEATEEKRTKQMPVTKLKDQVDSLMKDLMAVQSTTTAGASDIDNLSDLEETEDPDFSKAIMDDVLEYELIGLDGVEDDE
jgi:hypothetical protein